MLCCRPKRDSYSVEAEEAADTKDGKDKKSEDVKDSKTKGDNSKVTENKGSESDKVDGVEEAQEVVEPPVEVKVTEAVQSAPITAGSEVKDKQVVDHGAGGPLSNSKRYATQTSICSQVSTREDIYRSRDQFFSSNSLCESLQEERALTPNEKFWAYQKRYYRGISQEYVMSLEQMSTVVQRLESVACRLENLATTVPKTGGGAGGGGGGSSGAVPTAVLSFDAVVGEQFTKFMELSNKIGGDVQTHADMVKQAFAALRAIIGTAANSKKPGDSDLPAVLKPLSDEINAVQTFRENNRKSEFFNHLSTLSESVPAFGWVAVSPTPGPFVKDMQDPGMFFSNRVIKDFKGKDETHVAWSKAWNAMLSALIGYIKDNHTTGLTWNPQGGDAKAAAPAPAAGGPPPPPPPPAGPPPPPPAPEVPTGGSGGAGSSDDARAALFDSINQGGAVTSGLKHVSDDMKTHKNPALKASSTVPGVRAGPAPFKASSSTSGPPPVSPKPNTKAAPAAKPPVFELQDKKWMVEYQVGNKGMVIDDTNLKQTLYIYKCTDSTVQVKGKINSITVDNCKKVAVAFDSVVSCIDFVNCQSVQAQVFGKCPIVTIDKTDGCQMYLSKESIDCEIVTAKSSEMNISIPQDDGEFVEHALPEQFRTSFDGKKFNTTCTESV